MCFTTNNHIWKMPKIQHFIKIMSIIARADLPKIFGNFCACFFFGRLTMKLHDCRPVDNLVKLQTKDDGLPLGFCTALFVKSLLLYKTEKKTWRNFCPQKI